jgi:anti-sigma regulatory factor (Ser/Thr protein kinase)
MTEQAAKSLVTGITLSPDGDSPGRAREFVGATLRASGAISMTEDALLLTSELVTNAFAHAGRPVTLTLVLDDRRLRVAVSDNSDKPPCRRGGTSHSDDGNSGLQLVDEKATSWGVSLILGGKAVWFELEAHGES